MKKYQIISKFSICSGKVEKFLVKPRYNESAGHFFLIFDIAEYLKKFTNKIKIFETKKPDIVFEINKKLFCKLFSM